MKQFDVYLQRQRMQEASAYIVEGSVVVDVGCRDGTLFHVLGDRLKFGIGYDPYLSSVVEGENYILKPCRFVVEEVAARSVDCITLLAVLEHLDAGAIEAMLHAAEYALRQGGRIVITVPDAKVDYLLAILSFFRIIEGQSLEEHHGFDARSTRGIFEKSGVFKLLIHKRFQLGLNNLFVFEKT